MLGPPVGQQDRLFYDFCLEDVVPADHLLRKIDAVLDLSWLRGELKRHYSDIGRPSVCPELMVRMLLVGYCYSTRWKRLALASITEASTAKPSPPTRPAFMHEQTNFSKTLRKRSLSRKRPRRLTEKVE